MLLDEVSAVLARPKFRRHLSVENARRFVEVIGQLAAVEDDPPEGDGPVTDDPDDDFLVADPTGPGRGTLRGSCRWWRPGRS